MILDCSGVYGLQPSPGRPDMCMYVGTSGPGSTIGNDGALIGMWLFCR